MERPRYTPPVEQVDNLNSSVEQPLIDESIYAMSIRDRDNLEWKQGKELRTMEGPNQLHGVYRKGVYYHYGVPQRKKS